MTGGAGTAALWAWHAASEIGIRRLDVEAALGHPHVITDLEALDSAAYIAEYFMSALRVDASEDPGEVTMELLTEAGDLIRSKAKGRVTMRGPSAQVLLAIWGSATRTHRRVGPRSSRLGHMARASGQGEAVRHLKLSPT